MAWFKSNKVETRIANILKGTSDPASSIGDNGQLYLKYIDIADAYSLREYIEVGNTAGPYIDTGLTTSSNDTKLTTETEVIYSYTDRPDHNTWMFGAFSGYGIILGYQNGQTEGYVGSGGKLLDYDTNVHTVAFKDGGLYADDSLKQTGNWTQIPNNTPIYIFGRGGDNRVIKNTRIYRCKIWQNGVLLRDLIPVQRKSDDAIGMLDLVNNIFYDNDGTGSFTCGGTSDISSPIFESYAKVNGHWQNLIGTDVDEIAYTSKPPVKDISYLKWQITKTRSVPAGDCIQVAEFRLYQNAEKYVWSSNVSISSDMTGVSGETIDKLIDDNINTKFNTQDWGSVQENECNIIINLGETITLTNTSSYCFVTANDEISRDPVSWKLYSSVDGTHWGLLDERTDADIPTDRGRQTFNYPCNIGDGGRSAIEDYTTNYFPCLLDSNYYTIFSKVANDEIYNGGRGGTRASSDPVFYFCCKTTSFWGYGLIGLTSASVQVTATTTYGSAVYYTQTTTNGDTVYLARLASMNGGQSSTVFKNGYFKIEIDGSQYVEQDGSTDLFDQTFVDAVYEALTALS